MNISLQYKALIKHKAGFELGPVDLQLTQGMSYALTGTNGSGKTTLLKLAMNLLKPDAGEVLIEGQSLSEREQDWKEKVAFVADPMEGCEMFTLRQLAEMLSPWYSCWNEQRFDQCCEHFKLPLNKRYSMLSQGGKKKAALTLALSTSSRILLLDEPTNGLDIVSRSFLKQLLTEDAELLERTVLFSTHSADDVKEFADAVIWMQSGKCEGPFDKDELTLSWARLWLAEGTAVSQLEGLPGVVECSGEGSPILQLISRDREATLAELAARDIEILQDQQLQLKEVLEKIQRL